MQKTEDKPALTAEKLKVLVSVVYGNLFLGSCYGLMAPFFPHEAEYKGATATQYGLIIGIYQLVMFLIAPVFGKMIADFGPCFFMKIGLATSSVCVVLFGSLNYVPSGVPFIALAFVIRCIDAVGAAAFLTGSYTIIGIEFKHMIGRALSIVETAFSFGLAVGPAFGGLLYGLGGFTLPFFTVGTLLFSGAVVNFLLLSELKEQASQHPLDTKKLVFQVDFFLDILAVVICLATLGFNEATLEPHLRQFSLKPEEIGGIFLISGIVDAVTAFLWGYFSERVPNAQILTCVSAAFYIICFVIIGPAPFLNFPTKLWVVILSQVFLGLGLSGEIVCSMTHGMKNAIERGLPDDVSTYGMVSSLIFSAACLGGFAGPSIGGLLLDHVGYRYGTVVVMVFKIVMCILLLLRLSTKSCNKNGAEKPV